MIHELKTLPQPFDAVRCGAKKHEFRVNDRCFSVGDTLVLKRWNPEPGPNQLLGNFTGESIEATVTYISKGPDWGIPEGFVVMSIETLGEWKTPAELRISIEKEHKIIFSAASFTDMITRCNPPGLKIQRSKRGTRIVMVRASHEFIEWVVAHVRKWRRSA